MGMVTITETWPMGHRLQRHGGACRLLHGHTYTAEFAFEGELQQGGAADGMVHDFSDLKMLVRSVTTPLDHAMMLQSDDPAVPACDPWAKVERVEFPPTAERIAQWLAALVLRRLDGSRYLPALRTVRVWESPNTSAIYEVVPGE